MSKNIFEIASRERFRFDTRVGQLTVEELWQLPLTASTKPSLDAIAIELNRQLKGSEESFVSANRKDAVLEQKLELVKHIIEVRVTETEKKLADRARADKRDQLMQLIARKKDAELEGKSVEELEEMVNGL